VGSGGLSIPGQCRLAETSPRAGRSRKVGGVGVDSKDNVYVFNRGEHPMMIFDREGSFLPLVGRGSVSKGPLASIMAPDDTMFLTDDGGHFVRKVTLDGKVLLELGVPGKPAPYMSGEPFHPLHSHRARAERLISIFRRLRQFARPQIFARRQAADVVGRARHRRGRIQYRPQHLLRCRWLGLCRRPREPSRPGVRRQRQNSKSNGRTCIVLAVSA